MHMTLSTPASGHGFSKQHGGAPLCPMLPLLRTSHLLSGRRNLFNTNVRKVAIGIQTRWGIRTHPQPLGPSETEDTVRSCRCGRQLDSFGSCQRPTCSSGSWTSSGSIPLMRGGWTVVVDGLPLHAGVQLAIDRLMLCVVMALPGEELQ